MKTIEESIELISFEIAHNSVDFNSRDVDLCVIEDGLRQIATEQKAIDDAHLADIVKQWKEEEEMWIKQESSGKELLYVVDKTTQRVKREMVDKFVSIFGEHLETLGLTEDDIRKAMEG